MNNEILDLKIINIFNHNNNIYFDNKKNKILSRKYIDKLEEPELLKLKTQLFICPKCNKIYFNKNNEVCDICNNKILNDNLSTTKLEIDNEKIKIITTNYYHKINILQKFLTFDLIYLKDFKIIKYEKEFWLTPTKKFFLKNSNTTVIKKTKTNNCIYLQYNKNINFGYDFNIDYEIEKFISFFNYLNQKNLIDIYFNNLNLLLLLNKTKNLYFIEKILQNKETFTKYIFNKNYNKESFKLIQEINKLNLNLFKKEEFNFLLELGYENNINGLKLFFKNITKKENIEYLIKNFNNLHPLQKILNTLNYIPNYKIINSFELIKLIKDKNNINNILKFLLNYLEKNYFKKDYSNYEIQHLKIIKYIYLNLFTYKENIFIKNFINILFDKNKENILYNVFSDISAILHILPNKRKWKSIFKEYFFLYKDLNLNYIKDTFLNKLLFFLEFILKEISKNKLKYAKQKKVPYKKETLKIFEANIKNYKFKLLKTEYDFIKIGNSMNNCISGYYNKIKDNHCYNLIVIGYKNNKEPDIAIELEYNNKNISYIQKYTKYNQDLNKEQNIIFKEYDSYIKKKLLKKEGSNVTFIL